MRWQSQKEDKVLFLSLVEKGALSDDSDVPTGAWAVGVTKALGLDSNG